jgi:U3 small nucleolar RNA-associated protein 20
MPAKYRDAIVDNLLHHSHRMRLSALRLLSGVSDPPTPVDTMTDKLLEAESIPLTMQGVRERLLKIQRLELWIKDKECARLASLWLLGRRIYLVDAVLLNWRLRRPAEG